MKRKRKNHWIIALFSFVAWNQLLDISCNGVNAIWIVYKMHYKSFVSILFAVILLVNSIDGFIKKFHPYPYYEPSRRQIFGELTTNRIGYQHETRFGFPFFTREALISFPSVSLKTFGCCLWYQEILRDFAFVVFVGIQYRYTIWSYLFDPMHSTWQRNRWPRLFGAQVGYSWWRHIWP